MAKAEFPEGFVWGAATAAYQIEGASSADGRGESIWDRFCRTPGKVENGDTGDVACDHYHRYQDDVATMAELGLHAYRFSIAWPRVLPEGRGTVNQRGLDFYSRLVDALLAKGVTPFATLYHWDLPQKLQDAEGWANRSTTDAFAEYTALVARTLGDRVKHWIPLNEPQMFGILGHVRGMHAPGLTDIPFYVRASHHINLAHGKSVQALRANAGADAQVGTALNTPPLSPFTDSEADRLATERMDQFFNRWYADPILKGEYPRELFELISQYVPIPVEAGDLELCKQPLDFLGLNLYESWLARHDPSVPILEMGIADGHEVAGAELTQMGWRVTPTAMYDLLMRYKDEYGNPPMYITENGRACADQVVDGKVADEPRIRLIRDYLLEGHRALQDGADLRGYFVWSLMDNFEWSFGYRPRFGIIHVDYATQQRTLKHSAHWYRGVIRANAVERP